MSSEKEELIDVVVDGMSVPVEAKAWHEDHKAVEDQVRQARIDFGTPPPDLSEGDFEDYDQLGDPEDKGVPEEKDLTPDDDDELDEEADA